MVRVCQSVCPYQSSEGQTICHNVLEHDLHMIVCLMMGLYFASPYQLSDIRHAGSPPSLESQQAGEPLLNGGAGSTGQSPMLLCRKASAQCASPAQGYQRELASVWVLSPGHTGLMILQGYRMRSPIASYRSHTSADQCQSGYLTLDGAD